MGKIREPYLPRVLITGEGAVLWRGFGPAHARCGAVPGARPGGGNGGLHMVVGAWKLPRVAFECGFAALRDVAFVKIVCTVGG